MTREEIERSRREMRERQEQERAKLEEQRKEQQKEQERLAAERNRIPELTNPVDVAIKKAKDIDPTFHVYPISQVDSMRIAAIKEWDEVLQRNDITEEQRIFALWAQAGLYCRAEKPDSKKSEELFRTVLEMKPGFFCEEKFNAATMYGTHPGTPLERAKLLASSYTALMKITPEQLNNSAQQVNRIGFCLDKKFFPDIVRLPDLPLEQKVKMLENRCQDARKTMEESIEGYLADARDSMAAAFLLQEIGAVAPADKLEKWKTLLDRIRQNEVSEMAKGMLENSQLALRGSPQSAPGHPTTATLIPKPVSPARENAQAAASGNMDRFWVIAGAFSIASAAIAAYLVHRSRRKP